MDRRKPTPREFQVANKLVKQSERNDKLKEKSIENKFWKFFSKK